MRQPLLALALIIVVLISNVPKARADAGDWLSGWVGRRIAITIDQSKIDTDLTHFPLLLYLSSGSGVNNKNITNIFSDLGANYQKIAVTEDDGATQLYVEVEKWDNTNSQAWLWVSASSWVIDSDTNTTIYLYWDASHANNSDYVGLVNTAAGGNVWDDDFAMVNHLTGANSAALDDSTDNNNDVVGGATSEPDYNQAGEIANAVDNELGNSDGLYVNDSASLSAFSEQTIEVWVNPESLPADASGTWYPIVSKWGTGSSSEYSLAFYGGGAGYTCQIRLNLENSAGTGFNNPYIAWRPDTGSWHCVQWAWKSDSTYMIHLNGVNDLIDGGTPASTSTPDSGQTIRIGYHYTAGRFFDGLIDEVRVSRIKRPAAYLDASYDSMIDDLVTYGGAESSKAVAQTFAFASNTIRGLIISFSTSLSITAAQTTTRIFYALRDASLTITATALTSFLVEVTRVASASFTIAPNAVNWLSAYVFVGLNILLTRVLGVQVPSGSQLSFGFTYFHLLILIPIIVLFILGTRRR